MSDRHSQADYILADTAQREAANPDFTRLVSANAGSGKTKVLVDRVSRLLWNGVKPEKILCLTYTKAAASEMQTRLFETLGTWSVLPEDALVAKLQKLTGEKTSYSPLRLKKARELFASALEAPEGLKVQTIHAFCDTVLSRFPIEAGIIPGFQPMDDADILDLRAKLEADILKQAWDTPDSELAQALTRLALQRSDQSLSEIFRWIAGHEYAVEHWDEAVLKTLAENLNIPVDTDDKELFKQAWNPEIKAKIKPYAQALATSTSKTDQARADVMLNALTNPDEDDGWRQYQSTFFKKGSHDLLQAITTGQAPSMAQSFFGTKKDGLGPEALRVHELTQSLLAAECLTQTKAVRTLAKAYQSLYHTAKRARRWLDFDDQIALVRTLLTDSHLSDWVKYKLDGGIDHILLDEAQDTSPEQWEIINALKEGFNAPDNERTKTFFAVGDEKQSIYSFQGAKPELFLEQFRDKDAVSGEAKPDGKLSIQMSMSFRSCAEVLRVVDKVFFDQNGADRMFAVDMRGEGSFFTPHSAYRTDFGQVDLWPLSPPPDDPPQEDASNTIPAVDALSQSSSRERLAANIANQIASWIENGEPVYDRDARKTRPMHAGDFLILVKKRGGGFFDGIIRHLKLAGVPVAGADRLVLREAVVVKDLLALARIMLQPLDNLSLAEILKSPFFGFDDKALFELAYNRDKKSLWSALNRTQAGREAQTALEHMRSLSRKLAPYEFYARVLDLKSKSGDTYRKKIFRRLGMEAKDALESFLAQALAHQRHGAPSLEHFLHQFVRSDLDIKRELAGGEKQVRVMTVHGSKGLEAPIVFLPDTTQVPRVNNKSGLIPVGSGFAFAPNKDNRPHSLNIAHEFIGQKVKEEDLRLLYVAMTRAESRLIVCGYHSGRRTTKGYHNDSWYSLVQSAMEEMDTRDNDSPFGPSLTFGTGAKDALSIETEAKATKAISPDWLTTPAQSEPIRQGRKAPSQLLLTHTDEVPTRSPLSVSKDRFLRGNIIHKLLEILPDTDPFKRTVTARTYIDAHKSLDTPQKDDIFHAVFGVLDNPDFADIFAPGSKPEVSLVGEIESDGTTIKLSAQIDRLVVTDDHVYIIDFKSNRPPPKTTDAVPDLYWGQMAAYRELVSQLYPNKVISCALLWTDGPNLMILETERLDDALTQITSLPN